ncbi:MAG: peptidyl-prolyl cis-trans isomerase [Acidobacteria bacterium]|nr:peptidyl-prolyl cis-trans isomerase [Acidobacteriota bacterium]
MVFLRIIAVILISGCALAQVNNPPESRPSTSESEPATPSQNAPQPSTQGATAGQSAPSATPGQSATQAPEPSGRAGQSSPQAQQGQQAPPAAPEATAVPENAPVITMKGLCSGSAAKSASATKTAAGTAKTAAGGTKSSTAAASDCKTVITRAEWERMIAVINRPIPPQFRRQVAEQFVSLFEMANAGEKAGLEKDPKVQQRMKLSRMQVLGTAYMEQLREEHPPASAVERYYKANLPQFEEVTLKRIYVPKPAPVEGKPADEAAAKTVAQKVRDRAAAGEDFDKLQKEAYESTGNKGTPPPSDMGAKRRGSLPPKHEDEVFKLKVGEVSPPFEEQSGFFIYKVEKKDTAPLEQVKPDIERKLQEEQTKDALAKLKDATKVTYSDAYFGPASSPVGSGPEPPTGPSPAGTPRRRLPSGMSPAGSPTSTTAAPPPTPPAQTPPAQTAPAQEPPK